MTVLAPPREIAVIDIGSNSVRLVLYRLEGRAVWTVFNEKVLAGLGRDLATTGKLSPQGAADARIALKRFAAVIEGVRPERTFVAAPFTYSAYRFAKSLTGKRGYSKY